MNFQEGSERMVPMHRKPFYRLASLQHFRMRALGLSSSPEPLKAPNIAPHAKEQTSKLTKVHNRL